MKRKRHFVLMDSGEREFPLLWVAEDEEEALALLIGPESIDRLHLAMLKESIKIAKEKGECRFEDGNVLMTPYDEKGMK